MRRRQVGSALVPLTMIAAGDSIVTQGRGVPGNVTFFSVRDGNNEIYVMDWMVR